MRKTQIVGELGESALLLPEYVNRALLANDRVKYLFTLLQAAREHAEHPAAEVPDLAREQAASGVVDPALDDALTASRRPDGSYYIPHAGRIHELIVEGIREMLLPLEAAEADAELAGEPAADYAERFAATVEAQPPIEGDLVPGSYITAATRARRAQGDSFHLLVMDLHKALNRLQARLAQESVEGARVYGLDEADYALVRSFMRGVNATAPLKFDHPGLGTTATRAGGRLLLQNDIGTTDAHVLVVQVSGLEVVLTYTDIHGRRARFFQSLFEEQGIEWEDTRSRRSEAFSENDAYFLCTGTYQAGDHAALERTLEFLGSRVVFLIDWNRARKRLRNFVRNRDAITVLKWAADNEHGHRGFLELGGEQLVYDVMGDVLRARSPYGQRLDRILGRGVAIDYLRFVLRSASDGLGAGRSVRLIRDELKAELLDHVHGAERSLLDIMADHVAISAQLADTIRDELVKARLAPSLEGVARAARRAKLWESQADALVTRLREAAAESSANAVYARLGSRLDEVTDQLEDAAFLLSMLPLVTPLPALNDPLQELAELVVDAARKLAVSVETMGHLQRGGPREDLRDFLEAIDALVTIEHQTDEVERTVTRVLVESAADPRQVHLFSLIARRFEKAADSAALCGLMMRDYAMGELMKP